MSGERVRDLIPFVHVGDVARSIDFYEQLGFQLKDTRARRSARLARSSRLNRLSSASYG